MVKDELRRVADFVGKGEGTGMFLQKSSKSEGGWVET